MWGLMFHFWSDTRVLWGKEFLTEWQSSLKWSGGFFFLILYLSNKTALDLVEGFAPSGGCAYGTPGAGVLGVMLFWTLKLVTGVVISFSKYSVFVMKRGVGWSIWKSWSNSSCLVEDRNKEANEFVKMTMSKRVFLGGWWLKEAFVFCCVLCQMPLTPRQ